MKYTKIIIIIIIIIFKSWGISWKAENSWEFENPWNFYSSQILITVFTVTCQATLPWASWVQNRASYPNSVLILSYIYKKSYIILI